MRYLTLPRAAIILMGLACVFLLSQTLSTPELVTHSREQSSVVRPGAAAIGDKTFPADEDVGEGRTLVPPIPLVNGAKARFSGLVVDRLGNPLAGCGLTVISMDCLGGTSAVKDLFHTCTLDGGGHFDMDLPSAWASHPLALTLAEADPRSAWQASVVTRACEGTLLVVDGPGDPTRRVEGTVVIDGVLADGMWLLTSKQHDGIIAAGEFHDHTLSLRDAPTRQPVDAYGNDGVVVSVYDPGMVAACQIEFDGLKAIAHSDARARIIDIEIAVPGLMDEMVTEVEISFAVARPGSSYSRSLPVVDGRVHLRCAEGTILAVRGHSASRIGLARHIVGSAADTLVWQEDYPGSFQVECRLVGAPPGMKGCLLTIVPLGDVAEDVGDCGLFGNLTRRTSRKVALSGGAGSVRVEGLTQGRYRAIARQGGALKSEIGRSEPFMVPGPVVDISLSLATCVYFASELENVGPIDLLLTGGGYGAAVSAHNLRPGINGFDDCYVRGLKPGDYEYLARMGDRFSTGKFLVLGVRTPQQVKATWVSGALILGKVRGVPSGVVSLSGKWATRGTWLCGRVESHELTFFLPPWLVSEQMQVEQPGRGVTALAQIGPAEYDVSEEKQK